jgi:hypothetical protein
MTTMAKPTVEPYQLKNAAGSLRGYAAMQADDWQPEYEAWRHGGWYVITVRYPSGAVGCVSRNYPDGKWRVVCGDHDITYPNRTAAAKAERDIATLEWHTLIATAS